MGWSVRAIGEDALEPLLDVTSTAMHGLFAAPARRRVASRLEVERMRVVTDGGAMVGTSGAYTRTLSVPGGELACAGVTFVAVLPTHRRRGVLRAMMDAVIADARERGEPVAALWASEGGIYGRFGFGPATWTRRSRIELAAGVPLRAPVLALPLRFGDLVADAPALAAIHERVRGQRAGITSRPPVWWRARILSDEEDERAAGPKRLVVCGDDGYALYRVHEQAGAGPVGQDARTTVAVQELLAATPEAGRALLAFLTSIDLATDVELHERPLDDDLALATADPRALRTVQQGDALWLRILDLPAAVAGRAWAADLDLVLQVDAPADPVLDGRWALRARDGRAEAERSDREPDLTIPDRDLGAAYLGGTALVGLHAAGSVQEHRPGTVAQLDAALRPARAPWTIEVF
ncbi:GNAT family N-acetyltransferase [Patulibacter defluvii]|uniref:GNAT family N-acetyltransferase n=1 Tax=Patulibacter defluvii TaxID=3095358 RepID=UPI002A74F494|nr:GNAT family N-acetyltransferase [Patulibacter sp. DM4]